MPLDDFYNKIVALQEFDMVTEISNIINANSIYITDLLKVQLAAGKDGNGENVTIYGREYYKDSTIFNKEHATNVPVLGRETEHITNYMYGDFYNSIKVLTQGEAFILDSDIDYFDDILQRSGGSKIMELNSDSLAKFNQEILIPQLKIHFNNIFA